MQKPFVIKKLCCQRQENALFSELSFQLDAGGILLVEGANGSGKSSLLRLLAGLATPAGGDILWHGKSIFTDAAEFRHQLHYVGHSNGLRLDLTVAENLSGVIPAKAGIHYTTNPILTQLHLHNKVKTLTRTLSAGQKRKLALTKLLLAQKKLWLLDEPLTALDVETQNFFLSALQQHLQQGGMAVISSHQTLSLPGVNMQVMRLS